MARHTLCCLDGHTCGNPVRLVAGGAPLLLGATMADRRADFVARFDWIRTGLMFEPRGHDAMSGAILYPPCRADCDVGIVFIETSGCLPMCGHGTIGTVTMALENGLIAPRDPDCLRLDTPAGLVTAAISRTGAKVTEVRLVTVPSFVIGTGYRLELPGFGPLTFDIAYGGNVYAIIEPQPGYRDLADLSVMDIQRLSPLLRQRINETWTIRHPDIPTVSGLTHVMWCGRPTQPGAQARNAVFYGDRGVDRSPCGTGTSARMAQMWARGELAIGQDFVHESLIGSLFHGRLEAAVTLSDGTPAVQPSIAGRAWQTGFNTLFLDDDEPYCRGFLLPSGPIGG